MTYVCTVYLPKPSYLITFTDNKIFLNGPFMVFYKDHTLNAVYTHTHTIRRVLICALIFCTEADISLDDTLDTVTETGYMLLADLHFIHLGGGRHC